MLLALFLLLIIVIGAAVALPYLLPSRDGTDGKVTQITPIATYSPTVVFLASTPPYPEPTHTQSQPPVSFTPEPLPTATQIRELPTSTSAPPGIGGTYQGQGLSIRLADYTIHSQNDPNDEAVTYTLLLSNETGSDVELEFNLDSISAIDNLGTRYFDNVALAALWHEDFGRYRCICVFCPEPTYAIEQHLTIPASSATNVILNLNVEGTKGDCSTWGKGQSRVPFEADYLDLRIASIKYRTDQLHEFSDLAWKLTR